MDVFEVQERMWSRLLEFDALMDQLVMAVNVKSFRVIGAKGTMKVALVWRKCGRCRRCRSGYGHGPYWVVLFTKTGREGRMSKYLGTRLSRQLLQDHGLRRYWLTFREFELRRRKIAKARDEVSYCLRRVQGALQAIEAADARAQKISSSTVSDFFAV